MVPSRTRCRCDDKWRTLRTSFDTSDDSADHHWRHCYAMGILRKDSHGGLPRQRLATNNNVKVPYMILGEATCIVGTALLTRLQLDSTTVFWAASLVIAGTGMGVAMQLPYTAIQVVLK